MTQEEKQLLLKDLCGRLTTDVMVTIEGESERLYLNGGMLDLMWSSKVNYKPYLRPMSSMTEEEKKDLSKVLNYEFYIDDDFALVAEDDRHRIRLELCGGYINWLNAHHFDYRGLIPMGLALEAPEGMYKTE